MAKSDMLIMQQTLGELKEANKQIAESTRVMSENLKILNDHNILHSTETKKDTETIIKQLQTMTEKYWWLIIVLIIMLVAVMGYKDATQFIRPLAG